MKKNILKGILTSIGAASVPVIAMSAINNNSNGAKNNKPTTASVSTSPFAQNAKIGNMPIWSMELDNQGKKLVNTYQGVIVAKETSVTDANIKNLLKNKTTSTLSWNKPYDGNTKGVYTATISQNSKSFTFKIFVTDTVFDFQKVFQNKTLPHGFLFPSNVTNINGGSDGYSIFAYTKLNDNFKIPSTFTKINDLSFQNTILNDNFKIPSSVSEIGHNAFQTATLNEGFEVPDSVTNIGSNVFSQIKKLPKSFKLSNKITKITQYAFLATGLNDKFEIPSSVKEIENDAFHIATLNEGFEVPNSVTEIGDYAFSQITLPKSFKLSNKITKIKDNTFSKTDLNDDFMIPRSVTEIGPKAFKNATLNDNFRIPNSVTSIGKNAFEFANLNEGFEVPNSVTEIDDYAFSNITLPKSFKLSDKITKIKDNTFSDTVLNDDFMIPRSVTKIGRTAFQNATFNGNSLIGKTIIPSNVTEKDVKLPIGNSKKLASTEKKPGVQTVKGDNVTFTTWITDDENGMIRWSARVTMRNNLIPIILNGTIRGFQTRAQKVRADADAFQATNLKALQAALKNDGAVTRPIDKASVIADQINNTQTLKTELGIDLTNLATTSSYAISATGDGSGKITVSVAMTTPNATTPLSTTQTLNVMHKSDALLNKEAANRDIAAIKQALDKLNNTNSILENKATTLAANVSKTPAGIGFTEPPLNGVTVTYNSNVDAANGTITITATIKKGPGDDDTSTFTIKGFETTAQAQTIADQAIINSVTEKDVTLPSVDNSKQPDIINKPGTENIKGANVAFTKWEANDQKGNIFWEVNVTKGINTTPKTLSGTISGFQTIAQAQAIIDSVKYKDLAALKFDNSKLASKIDEPANQTIKGANVAFTKWEANDSTGIISWTAKVTKGTGTKANILKGNFEGFKVISHKAPVHSKTTINDSPIHILNPNQLKNNNKPKLSKAEIVIITISSIFVFGIALISIKMLIKKRKQKNKSNR